MNTAEDYIEAEATMAASAGPSSTLATAFSMAPGPSDAHAFARDSDMANEEEMEAMTTWPFSGQEDGSTAMMHNNADAEQEMAMEEYVASSDGHYNDGEMTDAVLDASEQVWDGQEPKGDPSEHVSSNEVAASSYETVASAVAPHDAGNEQLEAPSDPTMKHEQPSAAQVDAAVSSFDEQDGEVVDYEQGEDQIQDNEGTPAQAAQDPLVENEAHPVAEETAESHIQADTHTAAAPEEEESDPSLRENDRKAAPALDSVVLESGDPSQGEQSTAETAQPDKEPSDVEGESKGHVEEQVEESEDYGAPHPARISFNGQDFVLFPDCEPPCFYASAAIQEDGKGDRGEVASLQSVAAPKLAIEAEAYFKPLDALFEQLRIKESLGDFLDDGTELRLHFVDIDLEVREDDVYAREVTLDDICRLHEGLGNVCSLHCVVYEGKRFISRYNELAVRAASAIESKLESSDFDRNEEDPHSVKEDAHDIVHHGEEGAQQSSGRELHHAVPDVATSAAEHATADAQERATISQSNNIEQAEHDSTKEDKAEETFVTVADQEELEGPDEYSDAVAGDAKEHAADEYNGDGKQEVEEDTQEIYDQEEYDEEDPNDQTEITQYEPAEEGDPEEGDADGEEPIVEYDDVYEQNGGKQELVDPNAGNAEPPEENDDGYIELESPVHSNKRSLDSSYDDGYGPDLLAKSQAKGGEEAETKRARVDAQGN